MTDYEPLKSSSPTSMANSSLESNEPRTLAFSDDELVEMDDFASFKCYTPKEALENHFITFTQTPLMFKLSDGGDVVAHFYSHTSCYEMKPDDKVGIVPMRKATPFISITIAECEIEQHSQAGVDDELFDGSQIVAKKAIFGNFTELPREFENEFYFQFCYLSTENSIIGVSTPFRFQKNGLIESVQSCSRSDNPIASEQSVQISPNQAESIGENYESMMMEKRDDDDFIVVRSQESFLKERIEHLSKSNTLLEYLIRSLEKDLSGKSMEFQKLSTQLEEEKAAYLKVMDEKRQALSDFEDVSRKHLELQKSMTELKQLIEHEKNVNLQLHSHLNESQQKIGKLEDTFQTIRLDDEELKKILQDKEEEITVLKDMISNLNGANEELKRKYNAADDKAMGLQSTLANVLNERRNLMQERDKYSNYENLIGENQQLLKRIMDLESVKEKQSIEIRTLEDELRTSVANFNNLDEKYQSERNANIANEQKNALSLDKTKFELIEMHARLEQSRVEYANLFRRYRALQKSQGDRTKTEKATSSSMILSDSVSSNVSIAPNIVPSETNQDSKMDDIDMRLQLLEKEEEVHRQVAEGHQAAPQESSSPSFQTSENLLIEIDNCEQSQVMESTAVEEPTGDTSPKTVIPSKTTVAIPCIMCDAVIDCRQHEDGSGQMYEMVTHLEVEHKQKMCPVCSTLFDTRLPIFSTYFSNHIQNHFNNVKYPSLSSN